MTQEEKRIYLINYLLAESNITAVIPADGYSHKRLLRALINVRPPKAADENFLRVQDEYLQEELRRKGITDFNALSSVLPGIYLWRGDITTLKCDGIVNAANSQMLGCFCPNHGCIDNAIHTYAGVQLRLECSEIMQKRGCSEPTGTAEITHAFNLPCKYVLHTVGPVVNGALTVEHERQLSDCYRACLALAEKNGLKSLAFCCISTGEFRFPNERAAQIAVKTVKEYMRSVNSGIEVIFNVYKECDYEIYSRILNTDK